MVTDRPESLNYNCCNGPPSLLLIPIWLRDLPTLAEHYTCNNAFVSREGIILFLDILELFDETKDVE